MESYKTVLNEAEDSFIEKKSRFIGYCKPVKTEEEALAFIKEKKTLHWDASHNVYAYIIKDTGVMRYSDDGEPQGTAGMPVLDAMRKQEITDAVVVVTRYFGGILLGAGGLVRAYSHGAVIGIQAAKPVTMTMCKKMSLRVDYSYFTKAESLVTDGGGVMDKTEYDDKVNLTFHIPPERLEALSTKIADLTGGKAEFSLIDTDFYGI